MEHKITHERITLKVQDGLPSQPMGAYLAYPSEKGHYPGILLFMEVFGINSHIQDVANRIARQGYVVLAPDYFHRVAPGIELTYDQKGLDVGLPLIGKLKRNELAADVQASISYLRSRHDTTPRLGSIGFCIGGHVAYFAATQFDIAATASFYGGGLAVPGMLGEAQPTMDLAEGIAKHHGKICCFFGGQDTHIPKEHREQIEHALKKAHVRHEVIVYPEANHGFFCDQRAAFHEASRNDAWNRVLRLFQDELKRDGRQTSQPAAEKAYS